MKKQKITATDLATFSKCERMGILNKRVKREEIAPVKAAIQRGLKSHYAFEKQGRKECFIATQIWGENSEKTIFLRSWRDRALMTNPFGRALVKMYYKFSPYWIKVMKKSKILNRVTLIMMEKVYLVIKKCGK